jgi:hypothetical protein
VRGRQVPSNFLLIEDDSGAVVPPPSSVNLFSLEGQKEMLQYLAEYLMRRFSEGKAGGREVETFLRLLEMARTLSVEAEPVGIKVV